jgi:hypothetical protein
MGEKATAYVCVSLYEFLCLDFRYFILQCNQYLDYAAPNSRMDNELERGSHGLIEVQSWHLPGGIEETMKNHIRIAGVLSKNPVLQLYQPALLISDDNGGGPYTPSNNHVHGLLTACI